MQERGGTQSVDLARISPLEMMLCYVDTSFSSFCIFRPLHEMGGRIQREDFLSHFNGLPFLVKI